MDLQNGMTVKQEFPLIWEKSVSSGFNIPNRKRICENCSLSVDEFCDLCRTRTGQTRIFKASISEMKRKTPKEHGHM